METVTKEGTKVTTSLFDAAAARDQVYVNGVINRDNATKDMYADEGVNMEFGMQEVKDKEGNVIASLYLPTKVSVRAPHNWQQKIETRAPDHRGWQSFDNFVDDLLYGFGIFTGGDVLKTAFNNSSPKYYGPYSVDSYNQTGVSEEGLFSFLGLGEE